MLRQQKKAKATADVVKLIGESGNVYLCINDLKKKKSNHEHDEGNYVV